MPMNKDVWGPNVQAAIIALGISDNAKITPSQSIEVWKRITNEHVVHISGNLDVIFPSAFFQYLVASLQDSLLQPVTQIGPGITAPVTLFGGTV